MKKILIPLFALLIVSCNRGSNDFTSAYNSITADGMVPYVSELGSDRFMGREPFTGGEEITINYLAEELRSLGFEPAFNGSYFQDVPMTEIISSVPGPVTIKTIKRAFSLNSPDVKVLRAYLMFIFASYREAINLSSLNPVPLTRNA